MGEDDLLLFVLAGPKLLKTVGTAPVNLKKSCISISPKKFCNVKVTRGKEIRLYHTKLKFSLRKYFKPNYTVMIFEEVVNNLGRSDSDMIFLRQLHVTTYF